MMTTYLTLLRPYQWIKNLLVFVPVIFARELFTPEKLWLSTRGFVVFSLIASAGYIVNDLLDRQQDAIHPQKRSRPLASKKIPVRDALLFSIVLILLGTILIWQWLPVGFGFIVGVYFILSMLYSLFLKQIVIVDILLVASFYLLRVVSGGVATATFVSEWLLLVTAAGALLLVVGKRKAELQIDNPRKVMRGYSAAFLDQLLTIAASLTIISYGLYTILGAYSNWLVYSTIFVVFGVMRFLQISHHSVGLLEYPEKLFFKDRMLFLAVSGWIFFVLAALYS